MRPLPILPGLLLLGAALAAPRPSAAQTSQPPPARSVMEGVYTMEQADRGAAVFEEECALCHEAADFSGDVFEARWTGRPSSVLFSFMQDSLAHFDVADLEPEGYADLLAWVFRLNGFPAAATELPGDMGALADLRMEAPTGEPARVITPAAGAAGPAGEMRSVGLGVYTEGQAERGREAWEGTCAACHETTDFHDAAFLESWNGRPLGELFAFVREFMPEDDPGSLSDATYADVLAYVLSLNGVPAGGLPLPADPGVMARLRLDLGGAGGGGG